MDKRVEQKLQRIHKYLLDFQTIHELSSINKRVIKNYLNGLLLSSSTRNQYWGYLTILNIITIFKNKDGTPDHDYWIVDSDLNRNYDMASFLERSLEWHKRRIKIF